MKLIKNIRGDSAVLTLHGEFDAFVCNPFLEQIDYLVAAGVQYAVLNMRKVRFINSTGVGSIIKGREKLRERKGDLIISCPNRSVTDVLHHLGLGDLLKTFENDEEALAHFNTGDGIEMGAGSNILIHLAGAKAHLVGRIRKLDQGGIVFETSGEDPGLTTGDEVRLKFRLPLFHKSHYFDIKAQITEMVHSATGAFITTDFSHIAEEDQSSISQFVKDMQFLRKEVKVQDGD